MDSNVEFCFPFQPFHAYQLLEKDYHSAKRSKDKRFVSLSSILTALHCPFHVHSLSGASTGVAV
jgi:hypothetical protein